MDLLEYRNKRTIAQWIGWYQIIGGVIGIGMIIWLISKTATVTNLTVFVLLGALLLYVLSIVAGLQIKKAKTYQHGKRLTLVLQALQIFSVSAFGLGYGFVSGFHAYFGFDWTTDFILNFDVGLSSFDFTWLPDGEEIRFLMNVVPLFIMYKLLKEVK